MTTYFDDLAAAVVLDDLDEDQYHAMSALSSTGARLLTPPSTPAAFRYAADHPQKPKQAYDLGHAAHRLLLGKGNDLHVVDADSWRTKAAQDAAKDARANGLVPLLPADMLQAEAMALAVMTHPVAARLLGDPGRSEVSVLWTEDGVPCRARLDRLYEPPSGRVVAVDLKTTGKTADPDRLGKTMADWRYHQQADWYLRALAAAGMSDVPFLFIFVEKDPPHLTSVAQLDDEALAIAHAANTTAIETFRRCTETNQWPGYPAEVHQIALPSWAH